MSDSPFTADGGRSVADAPTETFGGIELRRLDESLWEIPVTARDDMRVPARVVADREILEAIGGDRSLEQLQNVACLPGIVEAALAMPDMHQGYGFPVGGVAATAADGEGVVSPGGVGYDINWVCHGAGRRLSRTQARKQMRGDDLRRALEKRGIAVRGASNRGLAEEAPLAYKEVDKVVAVVERAGLADRVARLQPIGVVKG